MKKFGHGEKDLQLLGLGIDGAQRKKIFKFLINLI